MDYWFVIYVTAETRTMTENLIRKLIVVLRKLIKSVRCIKRIIQGKGMNVFKKEGIEGYRKINSGQKIEMDKIYLQKLIIDYQINDF